MTMLIRAIILSALLAFGGCEWLQQQRLAASQDPLSRPLTDAAARGDVAEVDRLLADGAPLEEPFSLQAAVLHGQYEMVEHLVRRGAPLDGDGHLQSPLWFAAAEADTAMTRLLISLGADVNWQTESMGTPLHAALNSSNPAGNRLDVTTLLLDNNANVNQVQADEMFRRECLSTPLHAAVFSLEEPVVGLLIDRGADIRAQDQQGRTPLQCAVDRLQVIRAEELRPQIESIVALLEAEAPR